MQAVLDYGRLNGWLCFHVFDSRRSAPGFPDLCMVRDGELVFAELKTDGGKVTKAQTEWLEELLRTTEYPDSPVQVFIWRPADWPAIEKTLGRR